MFSNPKLKYIFKPFLILTISFIVGYNFLCWLLIIRFRVVDVQKPISYLAVPFALAFLLSYFCLRLRVKLLRYESHKTRRLVYILATFCMTIPTIIGLDYVERATGKLLVIDKIGDHAYLKPEKYYLLKNFYADQSKISYVSSSHTSGKYHRRKYSIDIYIVVPMLDQVADSSSFRETRHCAGWLGFQFSTEMSNNVTSFEKQLAYQTLLQRSFRSVSTRDLSDFRYLEREGNTSIGETFAEAAEGNDFYYSDTPAIFISRREPFSERTQGIVGWFFCFLAGGMLIFGLLVLIPKIDKGELRRFEGKGVPRRSRMRR